MLGRAFEQVGRILHQREGEANLPRLFALIGRGVPYLGVRWQQSGKCRPLRLPPEAEQEEDKMKKKIGTREARLHGWAPARIWPEEDGCPTRGANRRTIRPVMKIRLGFGSGKSHQLAKLILRRLYGKGNRRAGGRKTARRPA